MIRNKRIICFGNATWEGDYVKSTVKLLTHLSKKYPIMYVDYPFTFKDMVLSMMGKHKLASAKRMLGISSPVRELESEIGTKVLVLTLPPVFPIIWIQNQKLFQFFLKINSKIIIRAINKAAKKYGFESPVYINAFNQFYGEQFIGKLGEALNLYYCYDHINTQRDGQKGIIYEERFMPKADGIIVSSDNLLQEKLKFNPNTFLVKNGVDFDWFNKLSKQPRETNGKKIVGYVGSIDFRFATDLVIYAANQFPDYEFHIVGRNDNEEAVQQLSKIENIKLFPPVPHQEIPAIMRNCHVGLIPYTPSDFTQSVYPLKINEYLAIETPVVMTRFADLPEFEDMVYIIDSKEEFCEAIKDAVETPNKEKIKKGVELAKQNSWEIRSEKFSDAIDSLSR